MRCLARDPEHRPPTLHEVEVDLADAIRSSEGAPRRHTSHLPQPPRDRALALWRHAETFESIVTAAREPTSSSGIPTIVKPSTTDAQRESAYDQMLKTLRSLAQALRDRRLGAVEMTQVTGTLGTLEERSISVQMEIALLESRIDDLERETREREAFLRYALVDLSVERGRLVDEQGGASPVLRDLDFQISALERRIGEVWASQQRQQETYEGELAQRQQALQELTNQQTELEMRLLELVRDARPEWPPAELERMYRTLEQLLEEAF
jgi:chromosome segregation ATPase